jgi:hypothetical protein
VQERLRRPPLVLAGLGEREMQLRPLGLVHRRRFVDQRLHGEEMRVVGAEPGHARQPVVEFGPLRLQRDGALERGARLGETAQRHQRLTAMMVGLREMWIEVERAVEPGHRVSGVMQFR